LAAECRSSEECVDSNSFCNQGVCECVAGYERDSSDLYDILKINYLTQLIDDFNFQTGASQLVHAMVLIVLKMLFVVLMIMHEFITATVLKDLLVME